MDPAYSYVVKAVLIAAKVRYGEDYQRISEDTVAIIDSFPVSFFFNVEDIWNAIELARILRQLE